MRRVKENVRMLLSTTATMLVLLCCGCGGGGGSDTPPAPTTITAAQASAAATQIGHSFIAAVDTMTSNQCPTIGLKFGQEAYCNIPVASDLACSGGGSVAITGSTAGNMDSTNTGNTISTLTLLPANCAITGTNLVMNGDPSLAIGGSLFFFYGGPSTLTITETGPITYGPKPTGTCRINLTMKASIEGNAQRTLQSCTISGTACGQTINQSCQ